MKDYYFNKTIYNRIIRWSRSGIFAIPTAKGGKLDRLIIDATHQKQTANRKPQIPHDHTLNYKRHSLANMFGSLKGWRRIHTRYDYCVRNFILALCIAAKLLKDIAPPQRLPVDQAYHLREPPKALDTQIAMPSYGTRRDPYPRCGVTLRRRNITHCSRGYRTEVHRYMLRRACQKLPHGYRFCCNCLFPAHRMRSTTWWSPIKARAA